jgi:hypothetical protein
MGGWGWGDGGGGDGGGVGGGVGGVGGGFGGDGAVHANVGVPPEFHSTPETDWIGQKAKS